MSTSSSPVQEQLTGDTSSTPLSQVQVVSAPPLLSGCALFKEAENTRHQRQPHQTQRSSAMHAAAAGVGDVGCHTLDMRSSACQLLWQQQQQQAWADQYANAAPAAADQLAALQAALALRQQEAMLAAAATAASEAAAIAAESMYALQQNCMASQWASQWAHPNMQGGSSSGYDVGLAAALLALQGQGLPGPGAPYPAGSGGLQLGQGWTAGPGSGGMAGGLTGAATPAWSDVMANVTAPTNNDSMTLLAMQLLEQQQWQQQQLQLLLLQQQHQSI